MVSWLLLAISTISIFSDVTTASASDQCLGVDQRLLLLELRNSLVFNASESSKLVQWDQSANSWSGVTCEDGLVVGLDLSEESISGGIDDSSNLFRLEFLRSLNLAFNAFYTVAILSSLANLSRLAHLNLSNAGFAGQIPVELSCLTKLHTLDLSWAGLKLEKPDMRSLIGDLRELRELYLDGVNMFACGNEWCDVLSSSVPKLEVLSMSSCSLSGPINASLMSLANLLVIQLDGNNLSATVPSSLSNFSNLKTLSLWGAGLHGEFPHEIFQVQTLQTLDLSSNSLHGSLPEFSKNNSLQTLVLSDTDMSGRLPDSIDTMRVTLKGVKLEFVKILTMFKLIDFSSNGLAGPIPDTLGDLKLLHVLNLSHNALSGSIPPVLGNLGQLESLDLSRNYLNGTKLA
ncbi:probable LRR receptor-like serine/threonine-protein kinase At4g36180 [Eucalyptus grandis]|uniref:probable LRR receptor-like serine/threonine-protein kinase At4g36180 n=1 Tax=Eucalyptus grandis TaxID=71139 RepID=UPI00192E94A7|nr:probable LRR receptor-like serine/threonine-protein kinase At4g36180 [Eucalyptus grandis]